MKFNDKWIIIVHHGFQDSVSDCTADAVSIPPVDPLFLLLNLCLRLKFTLRLTGLDFNPTTCLGVPGKQCLFQNFLLSKSTSVSWEQVCHAGSKLRLTKFPILAGWPENIRYQGSDLGVSNINLGPTYQRRKWAFRPLLLISTKTAAKTCTAILWGAHLRPVFTV